MPRFDGNPKLAADVNKASIDVTFAIKHYAGEVQYNTTEWLEKNKDPLEADIADCVKSSRNKVLSAFFEKFQLGGPQGNLHFFFFFHLFSFFFPLFFFFVFHFSFICSFVSL